MQVTHKQKLETAYRLLGYFFEPSSSQVATNSDYGPRKRTSGPAHLRNPEIPYQEIRKVVLGFWRFTSGYLLVILCGILVMAIHATQGIKSVEGIASFTGLTIGVTLMAINYRWHNYLCKHRHEVAFVRMWHEVRIQLTKHGVAQTLVEDIFKPAPGVHSASIDEQYEALIKDIADRPTMYQREIIIAFHRTLVEIAKKANTASGTGQVDKHTCIIENELNQLISIRKENFGQHTDKDKIFREANS